MQITTCLNGLSDLLQDGPYDRQLSVDVTKRLRDLSHISMKLFEAMSDLHAGADKPNGASGDADGSGTLNYCTTDGLMFICTIASRCIETQIRSRGQ